MKSTLGVISLLLLVAGTLTQELNLFDAVDDVDTPTKKPKEQPKLPEKPKSDGGFDLNLEDAVAPDPQPKPDKPAVIPPKSGGGDSELDLGDALGPDLNPTPDKPAVKPPKSGGGGGSFDDSDLFDVGGGDYNPDKGRAGNPSNDPQDGADQPQEAGAGPLAGIISAVGVAILGAASSYFAYQKKKLCFKIQGGADPESGKEQHGQSDPQVYSNLLKTS